MNDINVNVLDKQGNNLIIGELYCLNGENTRITNYETTDNAVVINFVELASEKNKFIVNSYRLRDQKVYCQTSFDPILKSLNIPRKKAIADE